MGQAKGLPQHKFHEGFLIRLIIIIIIIIITTIAHSAAVLVCQASLAFAQTTLVGWAHSQNGLCQIWI